MKIKPVKKLCGEIKAPGDKSISHRAVMAGAIARGRTHVKGLAECDDCDRTILAFRSMGVAIESRGGEIVIEGAGLKNLKAPASGIHTGESGTTMRLLAGILAGQGFEAKLEGGAQLSRRPMMRIVEPLSKMGVEITASEGGFPPIFIKGGPVSPIAYRTPVSSAQVKSAILFAGLYSTGRTTVEEAFKSRDHTERMLKHFGADIEVKGNTVSVKGGLELAARPVDIPGDISSASFFLVGASLINGSRVIIRDVGINPTRAGILKIMSAMGARVRIVNMRDSFEPSADIEVESGPTNGTNIGEDMAPNIIDELPAIFVLAALSSGRTVIRGIGELKVKETDRINSMKRNLEKMGASFEVRGDTIAISGAKALRPAHLKSFGDHRTCMAMTIAALAAGGESDIDDVSCVNKSFPEFFGMLEALSKC